MEYKVLLRNILPLIIVFGFVASNVTRYNGVTIASEIAAQAEDSSYRLPKDVVPISYDLWLYIRLGVGDFSYRGSVKIEVQVLEITNKLVVHNDGLTIEQDRSSLYRQGGKSTDFIAINQQRYDDKRQFYIITSGEQLMPGKYVLVLNFNGTVLNDVFGFYRTPYHVNGVTKWMGVTQFSPTYARRAFPCMDEPHLKATFTLHVGHTKDQTATSNTEIESVVVDPNDANYRVTTFLRTPKISTYIVGWIVHDFVSETSVASEAFKQWSRPSMHHRGSVILNRGHAIYSTLESWLQVKSPIRKMDQFAVPDFNFNAMENWGLITFRESVGLHEAGVTSTKQMLSGLCTMAHEYAHTWFGNLVTPRFWDVAWLKEGFASYFQHFAISLVEPSWGMMEAFVVDVLQPVLLLDSANHTRTMNGRHVGSPSSIASTLDFVSYKKGASVIRMLSHAMGDVAFQEGLRYYLRDMLYQAASPFDLYVCLQRAVDLHSNSGINMRVEDVAESWTNQPGYPLVTITRNYSAQFLVVTQERFYRDINESTSNVEKSRWWIPLNFATESKPDFSRTTVRSWLRPEDEGLIIDPFKSEDWVIFNIQQVGYYRVNYDANNWRMLIDFLRSKDYGKVHRVNRAALLDDAFNLAQAGYVDYSVPFNLSRYLIQESEYEPWVAATRNLMFLNEMLSSVPGVHRAFQEHVVQLLEPMYSKLGFTEAPYDDLKTKLYRELILSASCSVNNTHCLKTSKTLFGSWISSPNKTILQDVKSFAYCAGIRSGSDEDWYQVWNRFLHTDLHTEQELLLRALGCTQSRHLIDLYLDFAISLERAVRKQYRIVIINAVLDGNPRNVDCVLEFVQANFRKITDARGDQFLGKVITAIGNKMTTHEQVEKLRSFVRDNADALGTLLNTAKEAVNSAAANARWVERYTSSIAKCLNWSIG